MNRKVKINCNLCGAYDFKIVYEQLDLPNDISDTDMYGASQSTLSLDRIVKCKRCGLMCVNPRLQAEALSEAYVNGEHSLYLSHTEPKTLTFLDSLQWIEKFIPIDSSVPRGRTLDVGSAAGLFMEVAEQNGWEVYGVEPNARLAQYAQSHLHHNVYNAFLDDVSLPLNFFNTVTMWDVIEHLTGPKEALLRIRDLLVDDGYLFLTTPDFNCVFSRILRRKWWFVMTHHLYYFTRNTIEDILKESGFELVEIKRHSGIWDRCYITQMVESLSKSTPNDVILRTLLVMVKLLPISRIRMYTGQMKVAARKM